MSFRIERWSNCCVILSCNNRKYIASFSWEVFKNEDRFVSTKVKRLTAWRSEASRSCKAKKVDCAKVKKKFKGEKKTNCTFLLPIQDCSRVNFTVHHLNTPSFSLFSPPSFQPLSLFVFNIQRWKNGIKVNIEANNIYFCF